MLSITPSSVFSWDFTVKDGPRHVADIDVAWFMEKGTLIVSGEAYQVYREGWKRGAFILESRDGELARATKPSAFFRAFDVTYNGRSYTLHAKSPFGRTFVLTRGGVTIGSVRPHHPFTRKATADFPASWPAAVRVFLVWLVVILWKRQAGSAAGSGAA